MKVLVINCGSSSVKYQLINTDDDSAIIADNIELQQTGDIDNALKQVLTAIGDHSIDAVGHRVVHGGDSFRDAVLIDDEVIQQIENWIPIAPLHNPANLAGIRTAQSLLNNVPHVAVFDTAFHATLPRRAYQYAIDIELAKKHQIRRFGFHGTSHHYVARQAAAFLQRPLDELRIISLHLGNGASACAVEYGHSTETSMGMTPLEGLVMGSRSGDIDPGALIKLLREDNLSADELDELLNKQSGLVGLSGIGNDLREIEARAEEGDDRARLAINVFAHRVKKYIGAYTATMGDVDAIVFTGGIGENSATMRQRILQRMDFLGLKFDEERNAQAMVSHDHKVVRISADISSAHALVIKTNEELMIAQQTAALLHQQQKQVQRPIPIAVSARHIHLNEETFHTLFGKDATPTPKADLSQPGQYACEETVNLIGPRNTIKGVRFLGPYRARNQVEISRTDEFFLGVDAPVRDSGKVKNSAPITVEGPKGKVHLTEGLICAHRHIHMQPEDAKHFGVNNKDEVEVAISGGVRDLIFADVLVRVSPNYRLEMHIDTDEANAAELGRSSQGEMVYTNLDNCVAKIRSRRTV